jgi:hypothetical protein
MSEHSYSDDEFMNQDVNASLTDDSNKDSDEYKTIKLSTTYAKSYSKASYVKCYGFILF